MVPTSCQLSQAHGELGEGGRRVPQNGLEKQRQALELQNNPISSGELGAISCGSVCMWGGGSPWPQTPANISPQPAPGLPHPHSEGKQGSLPYLEGGA